MDETTVGNFSISLSSGAGYEKLKKVYVIMIMPFAPSGENHMIYTIRSRCEELPDMPYGEGVRTIFLYTQGKLGNIPQQLREQQEYMERTNEANAFNDERREIHRMVEAVKKDEEVSKDYMKAYEKEQMLLRQGREEGREEELINSVEKIMRKKSYTLQQACELLDYTEEDYYNAKKLLDTV